MARYEITSPDGQKYEITAPDDANQEQVLSYAQSQFKSVSPKKETSLVDQIPGGVEPYKAPVDSWKKQTGDLISSSAIKGAAGLAGLPADVLTTLGSFFGDLGKPEIAHLLGKEAIVKGVEKATGTPLYKPESTAERYAGKAIEGAISMPGKLPMMAMGAASGLGGEVGQDVGGTVGSVAGSLLPFLAPAAVGKTAGFLTDLAKGRTTDIRAGKVLNDVADTKRDAIIKVMTDKADDITAAQAAVDAGSTRWSALGERAEKQLSETFKPKTDSQVTERLEKVRGIAGGNTMTEVQQAQDTFKKSINALRGPEREIALENANLAGRHLPRLQGESDRLATAAGNKVEDVRRMIKAGEIADAAAQRWYPVSGMPRTPGRYSYADELAKRAERVAQKSADDSLILGEGARFAKSQADSLAAHGLKPLKSESVVSKIDDLLKDPRIGPDDVASNALKKVRDKFAAWTNADGVIDAKAVETIRKRSVNDAIETFMGSADPKAKAKRAAEVMSSIKPSIDDAIVNAGGTGWKDYLKNYSDDMTRLNRQKLAAELLERADRPKAFVKLAKGNKPEVVQDIMGTEYDVAKALAGRNKVAQEVASEFERDLRLTDLAKSGKEDLSNVLMQDASKWRLPMWLNRYVTAANKGLDIAEASLNEKTMKKVYEAMENPQKALKAMNELPTSERNKVIRAMVEMKNMPKSVRVGQEMTQE